MTIHLLKSEEHHSKPNKYCRIQVSLHRRVSVQATNSNLLAAIDSASVRAANSVARAIERDNELLKCLSKEEFLKKTKLSKKKLHKRNTVADRKGPSKLRKKRSSLPHRK